MKTLKAGTYWVGDPCYVIRDNDSWSAICTEMFENGVDSNKELFQYRGKPFYVAGTAYGDGNYEDNRGNSYGVDSGCLGLVPIGALSKRELEYGKDLGTIMKFEKDFEVSSEDGVFRFDGVVIDTRGEDEEEPEEEFDEEDD